MKLKKAIAIFALVMLCLTLVVGCGDTTEPDNSVVSTPASDTVSDVESIPVDESEVPGETTTTSKVSSATTTTKKNNGFMDGDSGSSGGMVSDDTYIEGLPPLSSKVTNKTVKLLTHVYPNSENKKITKKYIKQYDLTVEYTVVPYANKVTRLIQMIAANDSPDVVGMDETYLTILQNNLSQSVEPYVDFTDKVWDDVRSIMSDRKWKGKIHEVICHGVPSRVLWYNTKLFKAQALKTPAQYYNEGKWNWDTFMDVAKKLTVDLDNNGVIDQYGFGGESLHFMFMGAVNESFVKMDSKGKIQNNMRSANLAKAMNMYADVLLNEGIYCPSPTFDKLVNNQMAMGYFGTWNLNSVAGAADKVKAGQLSWAPAPSAPGMKNYSFPLYESTFIPKGAKNPQGAGAYLTYQRYQNVATTKAGNSDISAEMQKMYTAMCNSLMTTITNRDLKATTSVEWAAVSELNKGNSWSSVLEKYSPMLDSELANLPK